MQRDSIVAFGKEEFEKQLKLINLPLTHFNDKIVNEFSAETISQPWKICFTKSARASFRPKAL